MATNQVDLSQLPVKIPRVQMGTPLLEVTMAELPEEQRQSLDTLFNLVQPIVHGGKPLDEAAYAQITAAYRKVVELDLAHFCPCVQIGASFVLDERAVHQAAAADFPVVISRLDCY